MRSSGWAGCGGRPRLHAQLHPEADQRFGCVVDAEGRNEPVERTQRFAERRRAGGDGLQLTHPLPVLGARVGGLHAPLLEEVGHGAGHGLAAPRRAGELVDARQHTRGDVGVLARRFGHRLRLNPDVVGSRQRWFFSFFSGPLLRLYCHCAAAR